MLGRKPQPIIGKLAGTFISGNRIGFSSDAATSPTSPLDYKIQSPRGLKSYDLGGVGLGIVAALEKSDNSWNQIQANKAVFVQNLTRSNPIPVKPSNTRGGARYGEDLEEVEMDSLEDYTFVTCHGPNKSHTRVYRDNRADYYGRIGHEEIGHDRRRCKKYGLPIFDITPARFGEELDHFTAYPASDFLDSCNLCRKKLHGKDIYMYRGEKAFCSTECRYRQIVMDERKEQCSSETSRSSSAADVSNSPCTNGQMFSTGILAI